PGRAARSFPSEHRHSALTVKGASLRERPSPSCNKCYNQMCNMGWIVITYRLPAEPSRHRVAVWRELRKTGAVSLQQATWAVPARPHLVEGIDRAADLV